MADPFDLLPNEMLLSIFALSLRDEQLYEEPSNLSPAIPFPWIVSAVCRRWRNIACSSPELWASINLSEDYLCFLPLFIERSGQQPIDVTLRFTVRPEDPVVTKLLTPLSSEIYRVRSLELDLLMPWTEFSKFTTILSANPAVNLATLNLRCSPGLHWWECSEEVDHFPIVKNAASLRSVALKGICSKIPPPFVGLTHLEIHEFRPTIAEFRDLFISNPSLSSLRLPRFPMTALSVNGDSPFVNASSLRSFSVGLGEHWGSGTCECVLTLLKMENLELLEIVGSPLSSVCNHFSRENGLQKVRKLRLRQTRLDISHAPDTVLWSALAAVTHIELDYAIGFPDVFGASPDESNSSLYFPKLTCLTFLENTPELLSSDHTVDAICSRGATGLTCFEVRSELRGISHTEAATKLEAAGIELRFIDSQKSPLAHYDSDTEFDDDDDFDEGAEFDEDSEEFWSDDYWNDLEEEEYDEW
ncbi:hypothetical protein GYMLUDRAFT_302857 [Collybiopsis luxurians FD-317 M1]|nr:hypothetical protein GYMLUDRAFT_302857 [Collybiopsis luxurians FD-317 M1]